MLYKNRKKYNALKMIGILILPVIVLILGYYIATNFVSPLLNQRSAVSDRQPYMYQYKIPTMTFYYVLYAKSDLSNANFNNIYDKELKGEECTGIYTDESDAKLIAQKLVSAKINAKIKTVKIDDITQTYTGTDKSEFEWINSTMASLNECITDESNMLADIYGGKAGSDTQYVDKFEQLKTNYQAIANKTNNLKIKDKKLNLLRNTIRTMAEENMVSVDGASVSFKLNDGNAYKIAEDSFIQSIELYKNTISQIVQK